MICLISPIFASVATADDVCAWPLATALFAARSACAVSSAESSTIDLSFLRITAATKNETAAAARTPRKTVTCGQIPFGAMASMAMIDPGDAGDVNAEPRIELVKVPVTPPAITARKSAGFIMTYGKYIS